MRMKTWNLFAAMVAGLAATLAGCDAADPTRPGSPVTESTPLVTTTLVIPEGWADWDHCEMERESIRAGGPKPPPWLSYCDNPRPFRTGRITMSDTVEEWARLKREWEIRHDPPVRGAK